MFAKQLSVAKSAAQAPVVMCCAGLAARVAPICCRGAGWPDNLAHLGICNEQP